MATPKTYPIHVSLVDVTMFSCIICGKPLHETDKTVCCAEGHNFVIRNGVYDFLPRSLPAITAGDAQYHSSVRDVWVERNQIDTLRNIRYHDKILNFVISRAGENGIILELGGGVGFDLVRFLRQSPRFKCYIFSEISQDLAEFARNEAENMGDYYSIRLKYANIDATQLPFFDGTIDIIYMIAALHHFPDLNQALAEMSRVLRQGGYLVCGIEPNRRLVGFLNHLKRPFRRLISSGSHSPADEEAEGFTIEDLKRWAPGHRLRVEGIEPVWFITGVVHYGLEFVHRLLRRRKRLRLPHAVERILIWLDERLLSLSILRQFAWHYTAIYRKECMRLSSES